MSSIIISARAYNKLTSAIGKHEKREEMTGYMRPLIYTLGANKKGVIREAIQVPDDDGCYLMSKVNSKNLARAMIRIMKKGYTTVGIARVGNFHRPISHHNIGTVRSELYKMHPDAIFLTVEPKRFYFEQRGKAVPHKIIV